MAYGGTSNGTNLWLYMSNDSTAQQFRITKQSDGKTYRLQAVCNDLYIDNGGSSANGFNTHMWEWTNSGAQMWYITDAGNGWYTFVNHDSGLVLDVQNGNTANGTNIQQYTSNGTDSQKFRLIPAGNADISDCVYNIESKLNPNLCLDVAGARTGNGTNLRLLQSNHRTTQQFRVTKQSDGKTYRLQALCNDLYIDNGASSDINFNTHMWEWVNTGAQEWYIIDTGDGWYSIINHDSGLALDVENRDSSSGKNIRQHTYNGSNAQKWRFVHARTLTKVAAKAATTTSKGNIEYWKCNSCGKLFKDPKGETEISYAETVIPKLPDNQTGESTQPSKTDKTDKTGESTEQSKTQTDVQESDGDVISWYLIRKSWEDSKSQKGAYKNLDKAKKYVDQNPGYKVFDMDGNVVYEPDSAELEVKVPFMVNVNIPNLNIRTGPGDEYDWVKICPAGVYTITEVKAGQGSNAGWGRLKSGIGWISLDLISIV